MPLLRRIFVNRTIVQNAGVVYQNINLSIFLYNFSYAPLYRFFIGYVTEPSLYFLTGITGNLLYGFLH